MTIQALLHIHDPARLKAIMRLDAALFRLLRVPGRGYDPALCQRVLAHRDRLAARWAVNEARRLRLHSHGA